MNERSSKLLDEMTELSVNVIKFCRSVNLPNPVIEQVTKSVTSIGANFSEAQDASSKKDFINKIYIAKKEASETKYWLVIISRLTNNPEKIADYSQKIQQFTMILQKIINTSKQPNRKLPIANAS